VELEEDHLKTLAVAGVVGYREGVWEIQIQGSFRLSET
jgi:hypothetical protein